MGWLCLKFTKIIFIFSTVWILIKNVPISKLQTIGFGFGLRQLEASFIHCTTGLQKCHKV